MDRYWRKGNPKDLESAVRARQDALDLTPSGHPDRAGRLQALGAALMDQYRSLGDPKDLEKLRTYISESFKNPSSTHEQSWRQALQWAYFSEEFQSSDCIPAFQAAFDLLPEILWIGHSIPVQHDAIHRLDISAATSTAIRTCIKFSHLHAAVEILEQGIATVFQHMLQLKTDVNKLPHDQARKLADLSSQLYSGRIVNPIGVVNDRNKLLKEIRTQPGLEYFLLPKSYTILCHASQEGPVIILTSHKDQCDTIILPNPTSEPIHVPLPTVTLELLKSQQKMLQELLDRCNVRNRGQSASSRLFGQREDISKKPTQECFEDMLNWLWTHVVSPVYQVLKSVSINMVVLIDN
jgi:hypothetical protein